VVTATPQRCEATWYFVDTVAARSYTLSTGDTWGTDVDERRLHRI